MRSQPDNASCGYLILTELIDPEYPIFDWFQLALRPGQVDLLRLTCEGVLYPIYYDISREFLTLRQDRIATKKLVLPEDASFELTIYTISGQRNTYAFRTSRLMNFELNDLTSGRTY